MSNNTYQKKTFANTNVIVIAIDFLKEIKKKLDEKGWERSFLFDEQVKIATQHDYCWDAIRLIQKHLSDYHWECRMTNFLKAANENYFTFTFKRKK